MFYPETVDPGALELLMQLMGDEKFAAFSLVGGTSPSLRLGHRISVDLDLFTEKPFDKEQIQEHLSGRFQRLSISPAGASANALINFISGVKVDFVTHNYPLIGSLESNNGIRFYSFEDVAAMKLNAISKRGARKDFWGFTYLLEIFSLSQMLEFYKKKYSQNENGHIIRSLVYFEDADNSPEVILTNQKQTWKDVKKTILLAVKKLF